MNKPCGPIELRGLALCVSVSTRQSKDRFLFRLLFISKDTIIRNLLRFVNFQLRVCLIKPQLQLDNHNVKLNVPNKSQNPIVLWKN